MDNLNINQVEELFAIYDTNEDDFLNFEEFKQLLTPRKEEFAQIMEFGTKKVNIENQNFQKVSILK